MGYQINTAGDIISSVIRYYANQGGGVTDIKTRQRAEFLLNMIASEFHRMAPWWFKLADSSVSLSSGVGTMPTDFDNMGLQGTVWISGNPTYGPLKYEEPRVVQGYLLSSPASVTTPYVWTLHGRTALGIPKIITYPISNSTLLIKDYVRKMADLTDYPGAPTIAIGAATGLSEVAIGKVTYVTAAGETEGGPSSVAITVVNQKINWTNIPVSQSPYVTGRNLYRDINGNNSFRLAISVAENITTTYTGDVTDVTATTQIPTSLTAITGSEQYPDPYYLYQGLQAVFMSSQGDLRDGKFMEMWQAMCKRIWNDAEQGKNEARRMGKYGRRGAGTWSGGLRSIGS